MSRLSTVIGAHRKKIMFHQICSIPCPEVQPEGGEGYHLSPLDCKECLVGFRNVDKFEELIECLA